MLGAVIVNLRSSRSSAEHLHGPYFGLFSRPFSCACQLLNFCKAFVKSRSSGDQNSIYLLLSDTDVKQTALSSMAWECVVDLASPVSGIRWAVFSRPHLLLDLKGYPPTAVHLCPKASKQPQAEVTVSYWAHVSSISLNGCL